MEIVSFVLHGKIQGKKQLVREVDQLIAPFFEVRYYETSRASHAELLTQEALQSGCDYLIAVGGDGTLNEVVNGFLHAGGKNKYSTVLGVLPWGTGNDFVKSVNVEKSVAQLLRLLQEKSVGYLDAGEIKLLAKEQYLVRYFDNIADLGLGAEVVARVNGVHLRKRILGGNLLFFLTALKTFLVYRHKQVRVSWEGFQWEGRLLSLVVANGRFFGSGLGVAPDAELNDSLFEVIIFGDLSVWDYLKNYGKIRKSKKLGLKEVNYYRSNFVRVETDEEEVFVEADGEVSGRAPLEFRCLGKALPFLFPQGH